MMEWVAPVTIVQKRRSGGERERERDTWRNMRGRLD